MTKSARTIGRRAGEGQPKPVVVIAGPTASGKSRFALEIAKAFDGVIINADAMQVYRELEILTARPGPEDLAAAPHRLYGTLPGTQVCSAALWRDLADAEIAGAHETGRLPLVVGGTGLYLRALMQGLSAVPEVPGPVREAARQRLRDLGAAGLHAELATKDPIMAARLRPSDSQRLARAWEVMEATGQSLAAWQGKVAALPGDYTFLRFALLPPRAPLYAACDARFHKMLAAGALDEVQRLLDLEWSRDLPVMKALGVPELAAYLAEDLSLETAVDKAQQATRNYAKRQMTWLRGQFPKDRPADEGAPHTFREQYSESLLEKSFSIIRKNLLTAQ